MSNKGVKVFCFDARTGISRTYKNLTEVTREIEIFHHPSQVSHSIRNKTLVDKRYIFKKTAFTREEKAFYSNIALKKLINTVGEVWRPYRDNIECSSLGRVKVGGVLYFPYLIDRRVVIELSRRPNKRISLGRIIAEAFITGRPLKKDEIVYHRGSIYDFRADMLYIGTPSTAQKNLARSNSSAVAEVGQDGEIIEIYETQRECAEANFVDRSTVTRAIKSGKLINNKKIIKLDSVDF